jgi:polyketide cyclase/dehydrase/lipid transport protein
MGSRDGRYRIAQVQVTARTGIACPPEQVFDTLADLRNETQWNSRVSSAELLSGGPIGPGSRFAIVNGGTPYEVTITTYDRPSRLGIEASGKPDLTIAYTFTPSGEGTDLESNFDFRPRGFLRVLFPLLAPVIRRDVPKQHASLKALCER